MNNASKYIFTIVGLYESMWNFFDFPYIFKNKSQILPVFKILNQEFTVSVYKKRYSEILTSF